MTYLQKPPDQCHNPLEGVYGRGLYPLIYDCQGRLRYNSNNATRLEGLGRLEGVVP